MQNTNECVKTNQDSNNLPLAQRIRNFTGDHEKGNIHDVMSRNNLPVDYFTAKNRIRDLGWTDIEKILTTPKKSAGDDASTKICVIVEKLNCMVGQTLRTADMVKATGFLTKHISELMNAVYDRYHGLQRKQTNRGYVFYVASELELKQKASPGNRGIEMKGIKFVKRAKKPEVNTKSISPNWFIVKRFH